MRPVPRALPLAGELRSPALRVVRAAACALAAFVVAAVALAAIQAAGGAPAGSALIDLNSVITVLGAILVIARMALVREDRAAWGGIAFAIAITAVAGILDTAGASQAATASGPSPENAAYVVLYVPVYFSLIALVRGQARRLPASVWLDGVVAGLCAAAIGATFVFQRVLEASHGSFLAVLGSVSYPIGDLVLLALLGGSFALTGWRPGRMLTLMGLGLVAEVVADSAYLLRVSDGVAGYGTLVELFWCLAVAAFGVAAWQRPRERRAAPTSWPVLVMPTMLALLALALLVVGNLTDLGTVALVLATAAALGAMVRTALSFSHVRAAAELGRQAVTDELTALPNRRAFQRRVQELIDASGGDSSLALVLIDLDGFKELNDTLGHQAGDLVLRQIGPRVQGVLRGCDFLARLGGDEFAVLLPGVEAPSDAVVVAERARAALQAGFTLAGMRVHVDASAGIACFPSDARDAATLLQRADVAMYQAKERRSGSECYDPARDRHSRDRLKLIGELRAAIGSGQIVVHLQPKASLATGAIVAAEALVRWDHPVRGLIPPAEFLPLAEQTGLMRPLTAAVLDQSLRACSEWRRAGHDLSVAVNVSAADLLDLDFAELVTRALRDAGAEPPWLVLEITEDGVMGDPERGAQVLRRLRAIGVEVSLDDFGTGHCSLAYLSRLPVTELKIDRSFVADVCVNPANEVIVRTLVQLARSLGLRVVAEGIEDQATWDALREWGCDEAQGYHLARPMPAAELSRWLGEQCLSEAA